MRLEKKHKINIKNSVLPYIFTIISKMTLYVVITNCRMHKESQKEHQKDKRTGDEFVLENSSKGQIRQKGKENLANSLTSTI